MNEKNREQVKIRRILVALDMSPHSLAALEAAANLAALLKTELVGLFVEDINLLRLAQLPFAHEVRYPAATRRKLNVLKMEQQLRVLATRARQELVATAAKRELSCSFRVVRGPVTAELLAAALEADLLVLGRVSHRPEQTVKLGSTARIVVAEAPRSVLLMRPGADLNRPAMVIYDGSAAAGRALTVAASFVPAGGRLHVLIWTAADETAPQHQENIARRLRGYDIEVVYRHLRPAERPTLAAIVRRSGIGLLVLGSTKTELPQSSFKALLEALDYSVLVVR